MYLDVSPAMIMPIHLLPKAFNEINKNCAIYALAYTGRRGP
jgi:hypothetical protein